MDISFRSNDLKINDMIDHKYVSMQFNIRKNLLIMHSYFIQNISALMRLSKLPNIDNPYL